MLDYFFNKKLVLCSLTAIFPWKMCCYKKSYQNVLNCVYSLNFHIREIPATSHYFTGNNDLFFIKPTVLRVKIFEKNVTNFSSFKSLYNKIGNKKKHILLQEKYFKTLKMKATVIRNISIWDKVFKNGPNRICGRQLLKNLKGYCLLNQIVSLQIFERMYSTNFTWFILEGFVTCNRLSYSQHFKVDKIIRWAAFGSTFS